MTRYRETLVDLLETHCQGENRLYGVLDGAQAPTIQPAIAEAQNKSNCLFSGQMPPDLAAAAPWLVALEPGDTFTEWLLSSGWGKSWAVLFTAPASFKQVRSHLRTLFQVRDERGRKLYFRWYDPRVLREYLPTCTPEELATVFGPIEVFLAEDETPNVLLEFRRNELHAEETSVELDAGPESTPALAPAAPTPDAVDPQATVAGLSTEDTDELKAFRLGLLTLLRQSRELAKLREGLRGFPVDDHTLSFDWLASSLSGALDPSERSWLLASVEVLVLGGRLRSFKLDLDAGDDEALIGLTSQLDPWATRIADLDSDLAELETLRTGLRRLQRRLAIRRASAKLGASALQSLLVGLRLHRAPVEAAEMQTAEALRDALLAVALRPKE